MTVRNIKKNLAGAEDLLHGIGVETQSRGGAFYDMHKLDTYVPTYDIEEMKRSSLTFMRLYGDDTHYTDYRRNPAGTVGIPSDLGGVWEPIKTSELQVVGNSLYGAYVYGVDQVMCHAGTLYSWSGAFPKVVSAGSTPATSGGVSAGAWVDRTQETLRGELAEDGGAGLVGGLSKPVTWTGFAGGADQSGLTDSTAAFVAAGYFAFVPPGTYLVDPAQVNINQYWGPGRLRYTTDLSEHWCGLVSKGTLYIRNDDRNPNTTPTVPADGLINLADGELKFLCDLDGDGDYDADVYGKNNLYIAGENSIHFRIDPQGPAEGRIRLASTTNTNFIQSGKDFSGDTLKNLAFGPYLSTDYWAFFSKSSGYLVLGNSASPSAPLHIYNHETTAALAENTLSSRARMGFKGSTTTSGTTVTFGANGNDAEVRAGGTERLVITADGFVRPATANAQFCGSNPFPWAGGFTQTAFTVTSDERLKTTPLDITDAMLDAAAEVDWVQYQYLDRVEAKGPDGARWHFGAVAQRYVEAFQRHGLDAHDFGFICYDEWDASPAVVNTIPAVLDDDGNEVEHERTEVVSEAIEAGSRYGIRYEEALALEAALQRRNYQRLLARVEALEAK